jgi:hypothetical protein
MNRIAIFILACLLFGAWPAVAGSPDREYLAELIARGYSTDDESLRALVRSETELEDARYKAAFLLAFRGVQSATEDIRLALASPFLSDRGLSRMATALLTLDPAGAEEIVVATSSRLKDFQERLELAFVLAKKGKPALYSTLLDGLRRDGWDTQHWAMSAVASLAKNQPPGTLDPDPFAVLIDELSNNDTGVGARMRYEAAEHLVAVLCTVAPPTEERSAAALAALRRSVEKDEDSKVRGAAAAALETLVDGLLADRWPPYCHDPAYSLSRHLNLRGRPVDDESLRELVSSPREPEDDRLSAAQLLSLRGVRSAAPDIRAALQSSAFLDRGLALLTHALLKLEGSESVKITVEKAGQLRDPALKLYLAQDLAQRGEPALYEVLLDHLKQGSLVERHIALSGVGALAEHVKPGSLQPDPVSVLIGQLGSDRAPIRQEAARNLAKAQYSKDELRLQATQSLRKAAEGDPAPEVKQTAADALKILEERSRERQKPSGSAGGE